MGDIWWEDFCGNRTIYDSFWSYELTLNTSSPDLTQCFQNTLLTWLPAALVWLSCPFYVTFLCMKKRRRGWCNFSLLNIIKIISGLLLLVSAVLSLVWRPEGSQNMFRSSAELTAKIVRIATYSLVTILLRCEYVMGIHTSPIMFYFWFSQLIAQTLIFVSTFNLRQNPDLSSEQAILVYATFGLIIVQFIATCFSDLKAADISNRRVVPMDSKGKGVKKIQAPLSPELTAPYWQKLTYTWILPAMARGFRKPTTYEDIYDLRRVDSCGHLVPQFYEAFFSKGFHLPCLTASEDDEDEDGEKSLFSHRNNTSNNNKSTANGAYHNKAFEAETSYNKPESHTVYTNTQSKSNNKSHDKQSANHNGTFKSRASDLTNHNTVNFQSGVGFMMSIMMSAGWPAVVGCALQTFSVGLQVINPQILSLMINYIEEGDPYQWKGFFLGFLMFVFAILVSLLRHNNFFLVWLAGQRVRSVVNSVVYRKALRLSGAARKETTVGEIVNMMAVDAQKLQDMVTFFTILYQVPLLVIISTILIWNTVGISALSGLVVLLLLMPVNGVYLGNQIRKLQIKQMRAKDIRVRDVTEVLSGIKILKLYAWELSFKKKLLTTREKELYTMKKAAWLNAVSNVFWFLTPYLVSLAIFTTYILISEDNYLSADKAFVTLSYINLFNFGLSNLPIIVNYMGQGHVSAKRLRKFLAMEEIKEDYVEKDEFMKDAVKVENGTFLWEDEGRHILSNLNVNIPEGHLVAIVGQVGSGKSSFLSALLGEMIKAKGRVKVNGSIAYVPQQAWIQNCTLKDNILFSQPYRQTRYKRLLEACALVADLKVLPGGDMTEIGEKGINLSGGQKQRISLARAVYQDEDTYFLDDPLSAVDAHVGKHIFDKVIGPDGLLKHKTRILVTHGLSMLPFVDEVIVLNDGVVQQRGPYKELVHREGPLADLIRNYTNEKPDEVTDEEPSDMEIQHLPVTRNRSRSKSQVEKRKSKSIKRSGSSLKRSGSNLSRTSMLSRQSSILSDCDIEHQDNDIIQAETSQVGSVKWRVIWLFVKAGGLAFFWSVVFFHLIFTAVQIMTNIWLSEWTSEEPVNGTVEQSDAEYRLIVYGALGVGQALSILVVLIASSIGGVSASRVLHEKLLSSILRAPMSFFDTTPLGRILNRCNQDLDSLDTRLPIFVRGWLFCIAPLLATLVIITYTTPIFIVVVVPLAVLYILSQRFYIKYAGQLKRIDSILKSPIYAHFDESISGAVSIRAYGRQQQFIDKCDRLIDSSQKSYYIMSVAQRLLGIMMELIGGFVVFFAAVFAVLQRDSLTASLVGLSVSYSLQVTTHLNALVRRATELETYMVAVERIDEYTDIPEEKLWRIEGKEPVKAWPQEGAVEFTDYATRYREGLNLVLDHISFHVSPGEKVGIVGRTGAGKSSLALALFRIIESSAGSITIDGLNVAQMGLHSLREKLTIIPQDPVIFSGTLRANLDPLDQFTDDQVWRSLEHAHLKAFVIGLDEGLEYECGEGGEALSVGQRQLVCLARALLRKSRILILDEATAAVDLETDSLIQDTIRTQFHDCTVLTVAHRLNTVMDYDRIMVLDKGKIKEFDSPANLCADDSTIFYGLAKEAGIVSENNTKNNIEESTQL